jgi:hypothetical protein
MKEFVEKYKDRIHGVLSCFDWMLFRGYLPIMSGWQMAQFVNSQGIRFRELKTKRIRAVWFRSWADHRNATSASCLMANGVFGCGDSGIHHRHLVVSRPSRA